MEKILRVKVQDVHSPLGPRELAVRARDLLIRQADGNAKDAGKKRKTFAFPNPVYDIDPSIQQSPGVPVTPEEQKLASAGQLKYMLQVEFFLKKDTNELALFQQLTNKIFGLDKGTKFLPWFGNDDKQFPEIGSQCTPYQVICGGVRLRNYLGPYNKN